jgi:hypothetical protein
MLIATHRRYIMESMRDERISLTMAAGCASRSLSTLSTTCSSVAVVSSPQNAIQSFAAIPHAITSLPRFTVPATSGTCVQSASLARRDGPE